MTALDRKLLRDFRRLWAQALAIALVLGCGVSIMLTSFGMYQSLEDTREAYYERNRFGDVFATVQRAPLTVLDEIAALNGVRTVEARVSGMAILDLPGREEIAVGRILSLPATGARLNIPLLQSGRLPETDDEVMVNMPFAKANGFRPGDRFRANLHGRLRDLTITGTALSPEFIYTIGPGAMMPDNEGFGILWMPERAVAAAFDMDGAFNDVSLKLGPGANLPDILARLDTILSPFGGQGSFGRSEQQSHSFIDSEIKQLRSMALVLPPIFFGISAFLVHMVIGRIVALERSEIGLLKAFGYTNGAICSHYLMLAGLIALAGIGLGWIVGAWLSDQLALIYARFYDFPYLLRHFSYDTYAISGLVGLASIGLGAVQSALAAARLAPAVAMSPPVPQSFRRGVIDLALGPLRLSQPTMMILRSITRWPIRAAMTVLGISLAVAVLVAASFFRDSLDLIMETAFDQSNRQHATLLFFEDLSDSALLDVARLPGVMRAEPQQYHAAFLRNGHLSKRVAIEMRRPDADLSRVVGDDGTVLKPADHGIILSARLARQLDLHAGKIVQVELLGERRESFDVMVTATPVQFFGLGAYMDLDAFNRQLRQAPRVSVVNVLIDPDRKADFQAALKEVPNLSGTIMMGEMRRSFEDTIRENVLVMTTVYVVIAVLITLGVAYNGARVQLSERARELASLRILGFTTAEVSYILVGELMLLALLAQPLGWAFGSLIALAMTEAFTSDLFAVPLVLTSANFSLSSLVVLGVALAAALVVRRRLDHLDLIAVMKTRE